MNAHQASKHDGEEVEVYRPTCEAPEQERTEAAADGAE